MKNLYIVNNPHKLAQCLPLIQETDGLLLIEDAVITSTTQKPNIRCENCYVLSEDLIARGLNKSLNPQWSLADYPKFVQLTLDYDKTVSWL